VSSDYAGKGPSAIHIKRRDAESADEVRPSGYDLTYCSQMIT
jgi:hypothetical protein